jgi:hypothetical protein
MSKTFNATTGTEFIGAKIKLGNRSTADTVAVETIDNTSGTNGAAVSRYAGTRDPNANVTATAGSLYQRSNGKLYVNTNGATAWLEITQAVASVQGSNGITPATATTGAVTLSGAALLPLDGSRVMTGDLDMGGLRVKKIGTNGLSFSGVTPKISTGDGADGVYYLPQYPASSAGDLLGTDTADVWKFQSGVNYSSAAGSRYILRVSPGATSYHSAVTLCNSSYVEFGYIQWRYTDNRVILGCTSSASGLSLMSNAYEAKWPTADGTADQVLTTNGSGQLAWQTQKITVQTIGMTGTVTDTFRTHVRVSYAGASSVTLPASSPAGKEITIKDYSNAAVKNNITITPASGTIDGAGTYVINTNRGKVTLISDGTNWDVM